MLMVANMNVSSILMLRSYLGYIFNTHTHISHVHHNLWICCKMFYIFLCQFPLAIEVNEHIAVSTEVLNKVAQLLHVLVNQDDDSVSHGLFIVYGPIGVLPSYIPSFLNYCLSLITYDAPLLYTPHRIPLPSLL